MDISNRMSERTMRARYQRRVNSLGKYLVLWANQNSELCSSDPWDFTERNVDCLFDLVSEMASIASQIDTESALFWKQMESILSKVK